MLSCTADEHFAPAVAAAGLSHLPDFAAAVAFAAVAQVGAAAAAAVSSVVDAFEG